MRITIEYAAQLKRAAGSAAEDVELQPPCSLQTVIADLAARHGDPLKSLLLAADGSVHASLLVFVGDEQIRDTELQLRENDVVTLLSPISGG